jgi:predicted 2-oxoglutarate/Fe(II)-dependent dioxygenase YbiX
MPRAGFFALLGWFVAPGFFDGAECSSIRREMKGSPTDPARILDGNNQLVVDADKRRTEVALVSAETRALVTSRLMATMPSLEKHFGVELAGCESPSFLVYKPGFYYGRHADANYNPESPVRFRERRVSISIFLNGEGNENEPDTYSGGSLAFSGTRRDDLQNSNYSGIALTGEEGLLLGFRSEWPHEVQPIQRGVRYSIVTWFA